LRSAGPIAAALVLALGLAAVARGEVEQEGNLIVSFDGGISPHSLPRDEPAPVAVSIGTAFRTSDAADLPPQLRRISVAINRDGRLFDRGLPTCRVRKVQPATIAAARRVCGGAIVGSGRVRVLVHLPNQRSFTVKGPLLVFNAERSGGHRRLLVQIYSRRPPSALLLTFRVVRRKGTFGTVITTALPKSARKWAYVTYFAMRLRRTYTYHGRRHSYVSAACDAPAGFPGAVYPFARAKFEFAGGREVTSTLVRDCKVR
jgi:hypothetical protein